MKSFMGPSFSKRPLAIDSQMHHEMWVITRMKKAAPFQCRLKSEVDINRCLNLWMKVPKKVGFKKGLSICIVLCKYSSYVTTPSPGICKTWRGTCKKCTIVGWFIPRQEGFGGTFKTLALFSILKSKDTSFGHSTHDSLGSFFPLDKKLIAN